jgi:hypothetical protein
MLGHDYKEQLDCLIKRVDWLIELPENQPRFFQESGPSAGIEGDQRRAPRLIIRARCIMIPESPLPAFPRSSEPQGVYTSDISRYGLAIITPVQLFPEEQIRIILPTFWMQLVVARNRRLGDHCFQIGATLVSRHDPSPHAFNVTVAETAAV